MERRNIQFSPPDITEEEINLVAEALRSGWITTGPKTKEFERQIAEYCQVNRAVCLNSATAALESILRFIDLKPEDEVITSAYTYTASASPVVHVGAKLVMVDTQKESFEMDYDALEAAINEHTKVIIPVDIGGVMCDYDCIFEIVERKKNLFKPSSKVQEAFGRIIVAADSAHGFGARCQVDGSWAMSGSVADFTSFSFHAVKNLTTAEGGALTWKPIPGMDDEDIYHYFQLLSLHGQNKDALAKTKVGAWEYDIIAPFYKCNMTDIMAAIGLAQMKRYPGLLERRKEIIKKYDAIAAKRGCLSLTHVTDTSWSSGHLYLLRVPGFDVEKRNALITAMAEQGVATNVHYKPLPMMTAYKNLGFDIKDYPNAYHMYENEITLPLHTKLSDEDVEYICQVLDDCLNKMNQ